MSKTEETTVFILQNLDAYWVQGGSRGSGSEVPGIDGLCVFGLVVGSAVLRPDQ